MRNAPFSKDEDQGLRVDLLDQDSGDQDSGRPADACLDTKQHQCTSNRRVTIRF